MKHERVYSEQEIGKIIERAIEHQDAGERREVAQGLTLGELERLGKEVGIAPEHLRRAAAEVEGLGRVGAEAERNPKQVQAVRWIPGRLSEDEIGSMFAEVKSRLGPDSWSGWWGRRSTVERIGRTYEWDDGAKRITLTDEGDGYTLSVFASQIFNGRMTEAVGISLWAGLALGGLPAGAVGEVHGVFWVILILSVALVLSFSFVPRAIASHRARAEREVTELADTIVQILQPAEVALTSELPTAESHVPLEDEVASVSDLAREKREGWSQTRSR